MARIHATLAFSGLLLLAQAAQAQPQLTVRPLTRDAIDDRGPDLVNGFVSWQSGSGADAEIRLWTGAQVFPVTNDDVADERPRLLPSSPYSPPGLAPGRVTWQKHDGHDFEIEIFLLQPPQFFPLTDNEGDDVAPDGWFWQGEGALGRDIFYNGNSASNPEPVPVTNDAALDSPPRSKAPQLNPNDFDTALFSTVWIKDDGAGGDVWVFRFDLKPGAGAAHVVVDDDVPDADPDVWGRRVAWVRGTGAGSEIVRYDPDRTPEILPITGDDVEDRNPAIEGDLVVWQRWDGHDFEIYGWQEGGAPFPLSDNDYDDHDPVASGTNVAWVGDEPGDSEIWVAWGLGPAERVQENEENDAAPVIDGESIAWESCDASQCDILLAAPVVPEPGAAGAAAAAASLAALARRRARPDRLRSAAPRCAPPA